MFLKIRNWFRKLLGKPPITTNSLTGGPVNPPGPP
jgi:hypothetical protein